MISALALLALAVMLLAPSLAHAQSKMFWTDDGIRRIQRANLDGSLIEVLAITGLVRPFGIAVDAAGGKMYWTEPGTVKIQRAKPRRHRGRKPGHGVW